MHRDENRGRSGAGIWFAILATCLVLGSLLLSPIKATAQTNEPVKPSDKGRTGAKADDGGQAAAKKDAGAQKADAAPADAGGGPPPVSGGAPTVTDTASLTPPGWLEFDPGSLKNLNRDRLIGTPFLLKVTTNNLHLQYRLSSDGYIHVGNQTDGVGDTYAGLHYLFLPQEKAGYDLAGRFTLKIPTGSTAIGGTQKFDYYLLMLASRDVTHWQLHTDYNIGLSRLTRSGAPGVDTQALLSGALTAPIRGGRWQYTGELVYFSPLHGQRERVATTQGFAYVIHRYETVGGGLQWKLHGDGSNFQVLATASFYLSKLF